MLNQFREGLTDKEYGYTTNFKCKTSQFYCIPKIHKSKKISKICRIATYLLIVVSTPNDSKL